MFSWLSVKYSLLKANFTLSYYFLFSKIIFSFLTDESNSLLFLFEIYVIFEKIIPTRNENIEKWILNYYLMNDFYLSVLIDCRIKKCPELVKNYKNSKKNYSWHSNGANFHFFFFFTWNKIILLCKSTKFFLFYFHFESKWTISKSLRKTINILILLLKLWWTKFLLFKKIKIWFIQKRKVNIWNQQLIHHISVDF